MNMYLGDPMREMPHWLQTFVSCLNTACCRRSHKVQPTKEQFPKGPTEDVKLGNTTSVKAIKSDNHVILDEDVMKVVRLFLEKTESENKHEEWKDEWKNLARLLDLIFCIITFKAHATMIVMYFIFVA